VGLKGGIMENNMKVRIDIDTRTFVRFWLVVIGFAFAILMVYNALTALALIGFAFFLALALNAPVTYIARHLPGKSRVGGTALAYVVVVLILAAFVFLVVPPIVQQTVKFSQTVPSLVENATSQWYGLNELVSRYHLESQVSSAMQSIQDNSTGWATDVSKNLLSGISSIAGIVVSGILVLVLSFLMLIEGPMWLKRLWGVYNDQERMEYHRKLLSRMYTVVTGYVIGQLTVSSIGAASAGLVVFILSLIFPAVPVNLALPTVAIAFTLSLIPLFGATIAGVIISILLAFNDLTAGIIFAIFFVIYQQLENNFISPTIQARRLELSALTVLSSVIIGVTLFGIAGGIISIPIAGCIKVLLEDHLERAKKNRQRSEKPLAKLVKKLQSED
jgi:predicted PurR-regulated permease PerM